jgi:hypothetical protein
MHGVGQESAVPERLTEGKRKGERREARRERRVRNERAGKTTGEHDSVGRLVGRGVEAVLRDGRACSRRGRGRPGRGRQGAAMRRWIGR